MLQLCIQRFSLLPDESFPFRASYDPEIDVDYDQKQARHCERDSQDVSIADMVRHVTRLGSFIFVSFTDPIVGIIFI